MSLTDEGSLALAEAVAASVAGVTTRRLDFFSLLDLGPAPLLAALGAALQKGGPGPSFELMVGGYNEEEAVAVLGALAAVLGRVSFLRLPIYGVCVLVVRSQALRRLEMSFWGEAAQQLPPVRFEAAPALESVLLNFVIPSEAAPMLAALASNPNLPALRAVDLTVVQEGPVTWFSRPPHPGPLAPLADGLRRALEQRAGGAVGKWRVEVESEPTERKRGLIRAWRP